MASNVLLCRWMEGWHEVRRQSSIDAIGRREAFLALGAITEVGEVERVGNMQLDVVANPRTAIAADLAAIDHTDSPYWAFNVGDTITVPDYGAGTISQRVRAITGAEDDNGEITYSPELGDLILEEQERTLQAVKKMADGTLDGESAVAQPPLRTQVQRMWTSPSPPSGGFSARSTYTSGGATTSAYLWDVPGGPGGYELTALKAVPETDGPVDGADPSISLWQAVPGGDGNTEVARVELHLNYSAGVTYIGDLFDTAIDFGDGSGVYFTASGTFTSHVTVTAEFGGGGSVIVVDWNLDRLTVRQGDT